MAKAKREDLLSLFDTSHQTSRSDSAKEYGTLSRAVSSHHRKRFGKAPDEEIYKKEAAMIREVMGCLTPWDSATEADLLMRYKLEKVLIFCHKLQLRRPDRLRILRHAKAVIQITDPELEF